MGIWQRSTALKSSAVDDTLAGLQGNGLLVQELPLQGLLLLRARGVAQQISKRASSVLGQELPLLPSSSTQANFLVLWLGPGKWLIVLDDLCDIVKTQQNLEEALTDISYLVVDSSDSRVTFEVSGRHACSLLAKICSIDLQTTLSEPGQCAQTLLVRIPLLLYRAEGADTYRLYVDRSFAHYAWEWLSDAASEFIEQGGNT